MLGPLPIAPPPQPATIRRPPPPPALHPPAADYSIQFMAGLASRWAASRSVRATARYLLTIVNDSGLRIRCNANTLPHSSGT